MYRRVLGHFFLKLCLFTFNLITISHLNDSGTFELFMRVVENRNDIDGQYFLRRLGWEIGMSWNLL